MIELMTLVAVWCNQPSLKTQEQVAQCRLRIILCIDGNNLSNTVGKCVLKELK